MNGKERQEIVRFELTRDEPFFMDKLSSSTTRIAAHRLTHYAISLLCAGELEIETDLIRHKVTAPALFITAPDVIRRFNRISADIDVRVLFFRKDFFLETRTDIYYLDKFDFFDRKDRHVIPLSNEDYTRFLNYLDLIEATVQPSSPRRSEIVRSFINILVNEIDEIISHDESPKHLKSRNDQLLFEFKVLVSENYHDHRQLSFYADKLNVTPKHLSSVIKQASGRTANEWINEMILLEAQVLLKNNDLSIAQIAEILNFTDTSHFGKFFKKRTGEGPSAFRNS